MRDDNWELGAGNWALRAETEEEEEEEEDRDGDGDGDGDEDEDEDENEDHDENQAAWMRSCGAALSQWECVQGHSGRGVFWGTIGSISQVGR